MKIIILNTMTTLKFTLIGDAACGKTAYMTRFMTGDFTKEYRHNKSPIDYSFDYQTTRGQIIFQVTETTSLNNDAKDEADGYMVMYDITSKKSFKESMKYIKEIKTKFP